MFSMTCAYHRLCLFRFVWTFFFFHPVFEGGGKQGFQSAPSPDSFIVDEVGAFGTVQSERGLTFYEVAIAGHMYVACLPSRRLVGCF